MELPGGGGGGGGGGHGLVPALMATYTNLLNLTVRRGISFKREDSGDISR